jgi:hypothetical protein
MAAKGQIFKDETIILDGSSFENCKFLNCKLVYSGGDIPKIVNCGLDKPEWIFDGAAGRVITFLRGDAFVKSRGIQAL